MVHALPRGLPVMRSLFCLDKALREEASRWRSRGSQGEALTASVTEPESESSSGPLMALEEVTVSCGGS